MAIAWRNAILVSVAVAGCAPRPAPSPRPVTAAGFRVLRKASPSDTGPPTLLLVNRTITIRGMDQQRADGGLYADVDSTQRGILRLTLFDSVPGRTVQEPSAAPSWEQVIYEAQFGPLVPGPYEIWVGRWDPRSRTVVVTTQPLRVEVQ